MLLEVLASNQPVPRASTTIQKAFAATNYRRSEKQARGMHEITVKDKAVADRLLYGVTSQRINGLIAHSC